MKKRILCYGDSLTWGFYPCTGKRIENRWTRIMAENLGDAFEVIEDGINGRTTVYDKPWVQGRNGLQGLPYALISQKQVDLVIVFLGTNDFEFAGSPMRCGQVMNHFMNQLVHAETVFQNKGDTPIYRDGKANVLMIIPGPWGAEDRHRMHPELVKEYMTVAKRYGVAYLCAGDFAKASEEDGVHYLPEEHEKLGRAVAAKVLEIFEE